MKRLEYNNDEIKTIYKTYAVRHPALGKIIDGLFEEYKSLTLMDIVDNNDGIKDDSYNIQFIISTDKGLLNIYVDLLRKKIKVIDNNKPYSIIYDDIPTNKVTPSAYEYENDTKSITKTENINLDTDPIKKSHYKIVDKKSGSEYTLIISYSRVAYSEQDLINYILSKDISTVRKLFLSLSKYLNFNLYDIKLTDSRGSIVTVDKGEINKYLEIQYDEKENQYSRVFLSNGEFWLQHVVTEKCNDAGLSFIKVKGEKDGKKD